MKGFQRGDDPATGALSHEDGDDGPDVWVDGLYGGSAAVISALPHLGRLGVERAYKTIKSPRGG